MKKAKPQANRQVLTNNTLSNLDGDYEVYTKDTAYVSLDLALLLKKYVRFDREAKYRLSIKTIDEHHLQINIFKNDKLIDTKMARGRTQDGYFILKKTKIAPFYFILNGFGTMTTRIELLDSGDLSIDHRHFQVVTFIIIGLAGDHEDCYGLIFKKLNRK